MLVETRSPIATDLNYLLDIDLKCFDDVLTYSAWRLILKNKKYGVRIGTYLGEPVGFIVWLQTNDSYIVMKLAVKSKFRKLGIGSLLLLTLEKDSPPKDKKVHFPVPESLCNPIKHNDLSQWLIHRGYEAILILPESIVYEGIVEDEVVFYKVIGEPHATTKNDEL